MENISTFVITLAYIFYTNLKNLLCVHKLQDTVLDSFGFEFVMFTFFSIHLCNANIIEEIEVYVLCLTD